MVFSIGLNLNDAAAGGVDVYATLVGGLNDTTRSRSPPLSLRWVSTDAGVRDNTFSVGRCKLDTPA